MQQCIVAESQPRLGGWHILPEFYRLPRVGRCPVAWLSVTLLTAEFQLQLELETLDKTRYAKLVFVCLEKLPILQGLRLLPEAGRRETAWSLLTLVLTKLQLPLDFASIHKTRYATQAFVHNYPQVMSSATKQVTGRWTPSTGMVNSPSSWDVKQTPRKHQKLLPLELFQQV
jgi:hypothetical protein